MKFMKHEKNISLENKKKFLYFFNLNLYLLMLFSLLFRLFWFKDIFVDKTDDKISNKTQCLGSVTDGFIKHNKMGSKSDWPQQLECEEVSTMHCRSLGGNQPTEKHLRGSHHSEICGEDLGLGVHGGDGGELLNAQVNVHHVGRDCQCCGGVLRSS